MKIALTLCLSTATASALVGQEETVSTTLTEIRRAPEAYRGVKVKFSIQFASLGKVQNPFFTQFEPSKYANFYGWADEQQIWQQKKYDELFGLLFVAKRHDFCTKLYKLKVYERLACEAVVRNVFQGAPWIEITGFKSLKERVNTTTLSHMHKGETWMEKRDWKRAIAELSLAPGEDVPKHVRGHIHKNLALCYLRMGEAPTGVTHLEEAVELLGGLDDEVRRIAAMAKVKPETFLDRTLSNSQVEDHQRPMWEAFEKRTGEDEEEETSTPTPPTPKPGK